MGEEWSGVNKTKGALPLNPHRESVGIDAEVGGKLERFESSNLGGEGRGGRNGRLPSVHPRPIVGLLNDSVFENGKRDIRSFLRKEKINTEI